MKMPESREEAESLLRRFNAWQDAKEAFVLSLTTGRDGRPLPANMRLGDYWTGEEADQHFSRACLANSITEAEADELRGEDKARLALCVRRAGRLVGLTFAGMRQLEKRLGDL